MSEDSPATEQGLARVLLAKCLLTATLWCAPLLLFPASLLSELGFPVPEPRLFLRLLGLAYAALLLMYVLGLRRASRGVYPQDVVWVGLLSNSGAAGLLASAAWYGLWSDWGQWAQLAMWTSLGASVLITFGLLWYGPLRNRA